MLPVEKRTEMKITAALCALSALLIPASAMAVTPADGDVFARSTARTYLSDPLPKATLDTLTAAAFSAPTAVNQRSLEFVWVTDKAVMKNLKAALHATSAERRAGTERRSRGTPYH